MRRPEHATQDHELIVYLDQSRVSDMARVATGADPGTVGSHYAAYQSLLPRLLQLVEQGRVVCPFSLWHAVESILFDDDQVRLAVCAFFDAASRGKSFRFFQDVFEDELAPVGGGQSRGPLGSCLDCFPTGVISPLTHDLLGGSPRPFTSVVEILREDAALRQQFIVRRDGMLDGLRGYVEHYHGESDASCPSVATVRKEVGADFVRTHLRNLVGRGLAERDAEQVFRAAVDGIKGETWVVSGIPSLGAWADVFATRVNRGGKVDTKPKRRGDAFDLCHMAALAHSDMFLMEKKFTSIGSNAARVCNTTLVDSPADLLVALNAATGGSAR